MEKSTAIPIVKEAKDKVMCKCSVDKQFQLRRLDKEFMTPKGSRDYSWFWHKRIPTKDYIFM